MKKEIVKEKKMMKKKGKKKPMIFERMDMHSCGTMKMPSKKKSKSKKK